MKPAGKVFAFLHARTTRSDKRNTWIAHTLISGLKKVRGSQPFNSIATSSVKAFFKMTGLHSETVVRHFHRFGKVKTTLPNGRVLRLWSQADDWVSNQVFWRGWNGYEPETVPLFFRLAARARVTVDVGAYVGFFTLLAAHANPQGQVYAFEPLSDAFDRLEKNVSRNRLSNVRCINRAVGEISGPAEFFTTNTRMQCSSSLSYEFMCSAHSFASITVQVVTLDSFVQDNRLDYIDLLKIDTESTEPQVLRGMQDTLRRDKPFIVCEVLGRGSERSLEEILEPLGYMFYHLTPNGPVQRERITGHPEWLNYLFTTLGASEVALL